jgi:predicted permease
MNSVRFCAFMSVLTKIILGPLVIVALIYMLIGITLSWIIKQLFWVPHRFQHGIIVAGGWANTSDIRKLTETLWQPYILSDTCLH